MHVTIFTNVAHTTHPYIYIQTGSYSHRHTHRSDNYMQVCLMSQLSFCCLSHMASCSVIILLVSHCVLSFCCLCDGFSLWLSFCCSLCVLPFCRLSDGFSLSVLSFCRLSDGFFFCGYHFAVYRFHFIVVVILCWGGFFPPLSSFSLLTAVFDLCHRQLDGMPVPASDAGRLHAAGGHLRHGCRVPGVCPAARHRHRAVAAPQTGQQATQSA